MKIRQTIIKTTAFIMLIANIPICNSCEEYCIIHTSLKNEVYESYSGKWRLRILEDENHEFEIFAESQDRKIKKLFEDKRRNVSVTELYSNLLEVSVSDGSDGARVVYFTFDGKISDPANFIIAVEAKKQLVAIAGENEKGERVVKVKEMFGSNENKMKDIKLDFAKYPETIYAIKSASFGKNNTLHIEYIRGKEEVEDKVDVKL